MHLLTNLVSDFKIIVLYTILSNIMGEQPHSIIPQSDSFSDF